MELTQDEMNTVHKLVTEMLAACACGMFKALDSNVATDLAEWLQNMRNFPQQCTLGVWTRGQRMAIQSLVWAEVKTPTGGEWLKAHAEDTAWYRCLLVCVHAKIEHSLKASN